MPKTKILVAMSGGVDSSAVVRLLLEEGAAVAGVTFLTDDSEKSVSGAADAAECARSLGVEHSVIDISREFEREVIEYFVSVYEAGATPNPCVVCNREIKFGLLLKYAEERGFDALATGHYARLLTLDGRTRLYTGADPAKDQSYMLAAVGEAALSHARFPLGEYSKDEVRRLAAAANINVAAKKDSQDICFIPDGDYAGFIERYRGAAHIPGDYVSLDGERLGSHLGHMCYTIGQRRGLGIALGRHVFVLSKDAPSNTVTLGDECHLMKREVTSRCVNLIGCDSLDAERYAVKLRYHHRAAVGAVSITGDEMRVCFDEAQRAPSAGQLLVVYEDDEHGRRAIGSAVIE